MAHRAWREGAGLSLRERRVAAVLGMMLVFGSGRSTAQVVLDGPNLNGQVGLGQEVFGSGQVNVSWSGASVFIPLTTGDGTFSARVGTDTALTVSIYLSSFQGGTNAYVQQTLYNVPGPSASATTPLEADFRRSAGRIVGSVQVVGGVVTRVEMNASSSRTNEYTYGSATATIAPYQPVLPFTTYANATVQGTAIIRADMGCDVPVTLTAKPVTVPVDGTASPTWSFDLSTEQCNQGALQGQVTWSGLGGSPTRHVSVSGPGGYRTQATDAAGVYSFSGLAPGTYYVWDQTSFGQPYGWFSGTTVQVPISAGELVTKDFIRSPAYVTGVVQAEGAWALSAASGAWAYADVAAPGYVGQGGDYVDLGTGRVNWILPGGGSSRLSSLSFSFYTYDASRYTSQSFYEYFATGNPFTASLVAGATADAGTYEMDTSEAAQVIQLSNAAVGLKSLSLSGNEQLYAGTTYTGARYISLGSQAIGTPQNAVTVLVRGRPGTYRMTATAQGTDNATYAKQFELVLGAPVNTPSGTGVVSPITIDDGTGTVAQGSITFGSVTAPGETTVSVSGGGPQDPTNFRVFGAGERLYYDIRTTAQFDAALGATVCLNYDDSSFPNTQQEEKLTLQHYVCSDATNNTGCSWDDITSSGFPDTTANRICGVTHGFSIFALFERLDADDDGIGDADDNCPAVANADQDDDDGDGTGNACDTDVDLDADDDGILDSADNCKTIPNLDQGDLDDDDLGDACDDDRDGDGLTDVTDNCPNVSNATQADFDADLAGDACDADDDADAVLDADDSCAGTASGALVLASGCSSPQSLELSCPRNGAYRNHGQYVQCTAHEAGQQVGAGLITTQEKDAIVATAAKSDTAKPK